MTNNSFITKYTFWVNELDNSNDILELKHTSDLFFFIYSFYFMVKLKKFDLFSFVTMSAPLTTASQTDFCDAMSRDNVTLNYKVLVTNLSLLTS